MPKFRTVEKDDDQTTRKRVYIIASIFACLFGILFSRAVFFHLKDNDEVDRTAMRQYRTAVHESTRRGKILDSAGRELAINATVESIWANPREIDDPVLLADKISKVLKMERRTLLERFSTNRKFVWVKRRLAEAEAKKIMDMGLKGIYSMRESSRSYPGKTLASSILGAVGFDSSPLGGVELAYNSFLSARNVGKDGDVKRDARGHLYLSPTETSEEVKLSNVELTIDRTLQYIAEKELSNAVEKSHAKGGSLVMVDVRTGEILAFANMPMFDPNNYGSYDISSWKNKAIADSYEPGSTFKTIIVATALDDGVVTPKDTFDCEGGSLKIGTSVIHDSHSHGKLSVADIIKVSSNIGAYKVEQKLGKKRVFESIGDFGFGKLTGIDLPGESSGILSHYDKWSPVQFATIAFGQGISVTPLQMAMAFASIANGGTLLKPHIVKRVVKETGEEIYAAKREEVGKTLNETTARTMGEILSRVVGQGGTATLAASHEYNVAGKTGTAQKAKNGVYAAGKYYASFVGFAPVENPRIAVYVGIDEPAGGMYYGGQVAAPVFREVVDATLHYFKVPGNIATASKNTEAQVPSRSDTAESVLVEEVGSEDRQMVQSGDNSWKIPDLKGLTMRGVLETSGKAEIAWKFVGSGIAVSQTPAPGSVLPAGAECKVEFKPLM